MVTIGMNYRVLPGKEGVFEKAFASVMTALRDASGHEKSTLYRAIDETPSDYLIVSRWKSEEAFQTFIASDSFRKVTTWGADNILAGRPSHTTYRE